jgi:predicted amidohydrolase
LNVDAATLSVAAVQMSSGANKDENIAAAVALVRVAAQRGATYIQLPEYFNFLGPARGYLDAAESIPGPTTSTMSELAVSLGVSIHLGSLVEQSLVSGKVFNTSVLIDPTGRIAATYRKVHLFDVDVPGALTHKESEVIVAGEELALVVVDGVRLGMSICFDLRFPELYRELSIAGAQVLCVPAAFNASTGRAHWETLIRSRAIENHAFVVAAAQSGTTAEGIATFGHSMIVDPWGEVIAESALNAPEVLVANLDLDQVSKRRAQIAVLELRRPNVYGSTVHRFE